MDRALITIGPITIYWYSVLIVLAVLIGYNMVINYSKKISYKTSDIIDISVNLVLIAIIGARLYYVLFNFEAFKEDPIEILMVWNGGLAIYGAIISGILYILYYCKKRKLQFLKVLDIFSLPLLLGQAIGRWGNFFNKEAFGAITTYESLKNIHIPEFIIKGMYIDGSYRQPTFLYESLWCLLGVIILSIIRKKDFTVKGKQISFYLIWYGIGRFIIEHFRSDSLYIGDYKVSSIVSIIAIISGIIIRIIASRKPKINEVVDTNGRI